MNSKVLLNFSIFIIIVVTPHDTSLHIRANCTNSLLYNPLKTNFLPLSHHGIASLSRSRSMCTHTHARTRTHISAIKPHSALNTNACSPCSSYVRCAFPSIVFTEQSLGTTPKPTQIPTTTVFPFCRLISR